MTTVVLEILTVGEGYLVLKRMVAPLAVISSSCALHGFIGSCVLQEHPIVLSEISEVCSKL